MKLLVVADGHYYIDKSGNVFAESTYDYSFYARYLSVFESVYAIARIEKVEKVPSIAKLASGKNVFFLPISSSRGFKQYLKNLVANRKKIKEYIKDFDCAIFRIPGVVPNMVLAEFKKTHKPFAVEVVVDPWEYFAKGTVKSLIRPIVRYSWTKSLKKDCMIAVGASYVTREYLQKKYPCRAIVEPNSKFFTESYSSVELPDNKFSTPRMYAPKDKYVISHVANAFSTYGKGHITLMSAVKILLDSGYNIDIWFIGDGKLRPVFEKYAEDNKISDHVFFLGRLASGDAVREKIRESDLFVFPTMAEGLPRAVLEAMAEAMPVISTPTCGIPEILSQEYLVEHSNSQGFANAIKRLLDNPDEMTECSKKNLDMAKTFRNSLLTQKRNSFYKKLYEYTNNAINVNGTK